MSEQARPLSMDAITRLSEPDGRRDPYSILAWFRDHDPVHRTDMGFYLLTRYADVKWTMQHSHDEFVSPDPERLAEQYPEAERHTSQRLFLNSLVLKNPDDHARLRSPVMRALNANRVNDLMPRIEAVCDQLLAEIAEPLREGETVDLHKRFSLRMSTNVFAELIGVPLADAPRLGGLAGNVLTATTPMADEDVASYTERFAWADESTDELTRYFLDLFDRRRRSPGDDLVSALVARRDAGDGQLDDDELVAMVWLLWIVGVEAVTVGIDQSLRVMLDEADQRHWLRGSTEQIDMFVEEAMRMYGSALFAGVVRITTRDLRFGDEIVPAGSDVRPSTAAANRDPSVFPDPDRFDPSRSHQAVLNWGYGMRSCIGAALSRAELRVALRRCHAEFPNLVMAGELTWHDGAGNRQLSSFPAALDGR